MRIELHHTFRDAARLAAAFEARVIGQLPSEIGGIATDSREVCSGDLFVALRGEHEDGARFCAEALSRGALAVLCDRAITLPHGAAFLVPDPIEALLAAAAAWRRLAKATVVAISGSAGKTTAKEGIAAVLETVATVACTKGNYNSLIGLPLSMLSFPPCAFWVLELGINHVGEMKRMSLAAAPDLAVLTSIGNAHIGQFGDEETLLFEKLNIAAGLAPNGCLFLPAPFGAAARRHYAGRVVTFGESGALYLDKIVTTTSGIVGDLITADRVITNLNWPIPGKIGAAALTVVAGSCLLLGCEADAIAKGVALAGAKTPRMRSIAFGEQLLLDDCYNASPDAVLGALEVLAIKSGERPRVAVLGDMLELGTASALLHRMVGLAVPRHGVSYLLTYGALARHIALGAIDAGMPRTAVLSYAVGDEEQLIRALLRLMPRDAAILFKGSGRMKMQTLIKGVLGE